MHNAQVQQMNRITKPIKLNYALEWQYKKKMKNMANYQKHHNIITGKSSTSEKKTYQHSKSNDKYNCT